MIKGCSMIRTLVTIVGICVASAAFAAKKAPCEVTAAQAKVINEKMAAEHEMKFLIFNKGDTKKMLDVINASPPETDIKADGMFVLEGDKLVVFSYIMGDCAARPVPVSRANWDELQRQAFGSNS